MRFADAFQDLKDYAQDVAQSANNNFDNNLRRFMSLFAPDQIFGRLANELLPAVEFEAWFDAAMKTGGSMVGSGLLDWPLARRERVALQLELLRRLASRQIHFATFCSRFCWVSNSLDASLRQFLTQVFQPFYRDFLRALQAAVPNEEAPSAAAAEPTDAGLNLVDEERLAQLRALARTTFDFSRLIRLSEELNLAYRLKAYHAVAALTRAVLDHVPPVFSCRTFAEVANNYAGTKSFREAMDHLQNSARKIGDAHLHTQIRASEVLPTATQVNFSNSLDVLLAEIVRLQQ